MDQAIAFLAKKGCAQFIEFNPLTASPVQLPQDCVFVIANCLSEANKAATCHYNSRVIECRLGCKLIAKHMELPWRDINKFADLQHRLDIDLIEMESLAKKILTQDFYTRDELLVEFEIEEEEFIENMLTPNTRNENIFKLKQRALHVLQESLRVLKFIEICSAVEETDCDDWYERLSKLLRQSHHSLQFLYECSHPSLDKLVQISENFGVSARLTGAGK
jgi:N-acetylgalactosamine kinase